MAKAGLMVQEPENILITAPLKPKVAGLSEAARRERQVHNLYLKNRHHKLREEFIDLCGRRCELCLQDPGDLKIQHRLKSGFVFQKISYLKKETRDKVLADCYVICQTCINREIHKKNPNLMLKMREKRCSKNKDVALLQKVATVPPS